MLLDLNNKAVGTITAQGDTELQKLEQGFFRDGAGTVNYRWDGYKLTLTHVPAVTAPAASEPGKEPAGPVGKPSKVRKAADEKAPDLLT